MIIFLDSVETNEKHEREERKMKEKMKRNRKIHQIYIYEWNVYSCTYLYLFLMNGGGTAERKHNECIEVHSK